MKTKPTLCVLLCAGLSGLAPFAVGVPPEAAAPEGLSRSLQIVQRIRPAFPPRLLRRGVTSGEVRLFLDVDASGVLVDQLVVGYTHRELADVLADAVRYWQYLPAEFDGRTIATTVDLVARFGTDGITLVECGTDEAPVAAVHKYVFHPCEVADLDRPLKAQRTPAPVNPAKYGESLLTGRARVDFFIDEKGHVRMPVVVSTDDERLGWAAMVALEQWRFDPPMRKGRAVLVRTTQTFRFEPESS